MIKINDTNVTIMVTDMDKAIHFYQSIGLTLKNRWDNHYAMMTAAGVTLGIHPKGEKTPSSGTVSVGFMITDIKEVKTLLEKNKISFKYEDDGKSGLYCHFTDLDGTLLYFIQPKW
jgi:catechol 2,3-dioxygenase-like lactoylglutathione lyase family enzyme